MGEQHFNFLAQSSRGAAFPRACDLACHVTGAFIDRSQAMLIAARAAQNFAPSNEMPEPATRSLIVRETTILSALPRAATREVMCTAMPLMSLFAISTSPV